ncbi:MAG: mRNA surveillance protein pelota [Candidatus Diapherotrites archaeon]|nr:mRNA surveillance protein pelota [Candidatus Diapherotrites archaeon]
MRLIKFDEKHKIIEFVCNTEAELWLAAKLIEKGDFVKASTDRKVKLDSGRTERIKMFLELEVSDVVFNATSSMLRVKGRIVSGKPEEFLDIGAAHSLEFGVGDKIFLKKHAISTFHKKLLERMKQSKGKKILVILIDERKAEVYAVRENSFSLILQLDFPSGKRYSIGEEKKFNKILEFLSRNISEYSAVVIAGPGFAKEKLALAIREKYRKKIFTKAVGSVTISGLYELFRKGLPEISKEVQLASEIEAVENLLKRIAVDKKVCYSLEDVKKALSFNAVEVLVISDSFIDKNRALSAELLEEAEKQRAEIVIVSCKGEHKDKLNAIGGIAALLRFELPC